MTATHHEDRFILVLQAITNNEIAQELSIPRKARRLDGVCRFGADDIPGLFGPFQRTCENRTILFEHESQPLTRTAVASGWVGQAWLTWNRLRVFKGKPPIVHRLVADTQYPPMAIIVADSVRDDLVGAVPGLAATHCPGIWATVDTGDLRFEQGGLIVIDTSSTIAEDGLSFWRWLGRAANARDADARLRALFADPNLPTNEKDLLRDAIMNHQIPATTTEHETIAQRVRREGREEGERQALLDVAARFIPESLPKLKTIDDLDALRQATDEALARKLGS